ncbi:MAG: 50S ribosomal protein L6 [Bacteroidales bacterium]|nr:50S ribosomal protein L6 [Bacteroidales bacterium]
MSRIGSYPIHIPEKVEVNFKDNTISVKGPLGELTQDINPSITIEQNENQIVLNRATESKQDRAQHGLYRSLVKNMIEGVSKGHTIELELSGVGYKALANGQLLELGLGFSHNIYIELPAEVKVEAKTERGKNPYIKLVSADKQLVGQVAAKIRSMRKPEPYKGKGVIYKGEIIRRKAGKSAAE